MRRPPRSPLFPYTTLFRSDTLRAIDGFGGEFRVIVSRRETMDELLISAEYAVSHADPARLAKLSATATERRSEEHTSELQSLTNLVCRLLLEKKKKKPTHR